jgi:hypothetical protein
MIMRDDASCGARARSRRCAQDQVEYEPNEMTDQGQSGRRRFRHLRRLLKAITLFALAAVGLVLVAVGVTWGHFWDFQVGSPSSDTCASCHVLADHVASLNDPAMLVSNHAARGVTCADCHDRSFEQQVAETVAFLTNDYIQPLPREQAKMDTCFACHEHASYDQIAWRTTDLGVTDGQAKGHTANPHQPPHYTELECNSCHRMHRPSTLLCLECHSFEFEMEMQPPATPSP